MPSPAPPLAILNDDASELDWIWRCCVVQCGAAENDGEAGIEECRKRRATVRSRDGDSMRESPIGEICCGQGKDDSGEFLETMRCGLEDGPVEGDRVEGDDGFAQQSAAPAIGRTGGCGRCGAGGAGGGWCVGAKDGEARNGRVRRRPDALFR